jgi:tetratricopeptide (TPR) repeat protein
VIRAGTLAWLIAIAGAAATIGGAAGPAAAQADDEESQLLLEEARRALARRDYERAAALLDEALRVNPRRIDLYVLRASVHGVQRQHDRAIALLQRARRLAPANPSVAAALGIQLVQAGREAEGVPLLETLVAADPRRYDAQVILAHHYVGHARWGDAVRAFEAYFGHRPGALAGDDAVHRPDYANALLRGGEPRRARALYREMLARHPRSELARLGDAWAVAAIDCREAMTVLDGLADLEARHGEVSLVRGRCALLLGRLDDALAAVERYRKARPDAAAGWALLGDVQAARRDLAAAAAAYQRALDRDPGGQVHALKLARTERLLGRPAEAAARLRQTGAPAAYEDDWTLEYGEALHALGDAQAVQDHLGPWLAGRPASAAGEFLLGSALHRLGDLAAARRHLARAHRGGEPRAQQPLIDVLGTLAVSRIRGGDLAGARRLLERAARTGDDVLTWRNLGAVYLAQDEVDRATTVLGRAVERAPRDPVALHLLGRALAAGGRADEARAAYARAIQGYGKDPRGIGARVDLAHGELAAGRGEAAVDAVTAALAAAPDAAARQQLGQILVAAARQAATEAMRGGRFASAVRLLRRAEPHAGDPETVTALRCDLALAATGAGQREAALDELRRLERARARCPFVAPADELALPILIAWNEGATLRRARQALDRLDKIRSRARGVAEPLTRLAARDIALRAAQEAYGAGNLRQAERFLADARLHDRKSPEVAHNAAVLLLAGGSLDKAIAELERLKGDVAEAHVNLGIAYERKGEPLRALEHWRRAVAAGVRHGPLREWIETKQRFWGTP